VAWMLRLVEIGAECEGPCVDVMEIRRPDDLVDIANLGTIRMSGVFASEWAAERCEVGRLIAFHSSHPRDADALCLVGARHKADAEFTFSSPKQEHRPEAGCPS